MIEVTIEEIAQDPLSYLDRTQIGESFVVLKAGKPIAQINPVQSSPKMTLVKAIAIIQEKVKAEEPELNDVIWDDVCDPCGICEAARTLTSGEPRW